MNKSDLLKEISLAADITNKQAEAALSAFTETIATALTNKRHVTLIGFGSFEAHERKARVGRNPKTGEEIKIPAVFAPKFKPDKTLKEAVAKSKSK
jgi:DNA-binding protein HU-beta